VLNCRAAAAVCWVCWTLSTKFSFNTQHFYNTDAWQRSQCRLVWQHIQVLMSDVIMLTHVSTLSVQNFNRHFAECVKLDVKPCSINAIHRHFACYSFSLLCVHFVFKWRKMDYICIHLVVQHYTNIDWCRGQHWKILPRSYVMLPRNIT